jgi:hypothetical protein
MVSGREPSLQWLKTKVHDLLVPTNLAQWEEGHLCRAALEAHELRLVERLRSMLRGPKSHPYPCPLPCCICLRQKV